MARSSPIGNGSDDWGMGDDYAWRVVLTPKGLELLAEALIRENAAQVHDLQIHGQRQGTQ